MKKFGIAIAVLMCFVLSTCFAEGLDLESMALDQLVDLRNEIQEAIDSRAHGESKQVYSGYYTAGSDQTFQWVHIRSHMNANLKRKRYTLHSFPTRAWTIILPTITMAKERIFRMKWSPRKDLAMLLWTKA